MGRADGLVPGREFFYWESWGHGTPEVECRDAQVVAEYPPQPFNRHFPRFRLFLTLNGRDTPEVATPQRSFPKFLFTSTWNHAIFLLRQIYYDRRCNDSRYIDSRRRTARAASPEQERRKAV